ncbi:sensor histidine kinase [Sulfobacillus harzensis]|uniref:histidine kinase n=1 Tax=Sulfobacillus harzensis TaxID=2729629 RepID=A0A7Y0L1W3_9FIRM|nr:HAMP domain-containing sensor histidine kinase [Sulfobacillus harzensis]NMP21777.1 HAMP domain-containing protein [Sulfobacillus harzensis]
MTPRNKRRTLIDQLIGRQVGLLAILLLVVGVSQYLILRSVLYHSTARTLDGEISVLKPIIHHTMASRGIPGLSHLAQILVSRLRAPGVEVFITNAARQKLASSSTLKAAVPHFSTAPYFIWNHRIVVDAVIGNPYYPSGYIWLLSSLSPLHAILRRDAELYVFLASLSLILAGWLGALSVRQTLRPLETIRESTQRIASGEFGHLTHLDNAPQEIEDLGRSIDRMSQSIQELFLQEKTLSEQMRRFVADASHELRTPLTSITGFLDLMARGELTPEEQARGLRVIRSQGKRMARLVNQLLTLSRMDSAEPSQLNVTEVALNRWLDDLLPEIQRIIAPRPLTTHIAPVVALAEPDHLADALYSLLENIQRYTPEDTQVLITLASQGGYAVLSVEDSGPGISPENLPHIFERFFRGDRSRSSTSGGTGLGLAIVKSVVEAMSGRVSAKNVEPHGMCFQISLPQPNHS